MTSQVGRVVLAALVLFVCLLTGPARADQASRITLKDSTVFENVTFTINSQYKTVAITEGDRVRTVSFTAIQSILDPSGGDVTSIYLGQQYGKPRSSAIPETIGETDSTSAIRTERERTKPRDLGLRLGGNFSVPLGDYYDGIESGIGFGADLIVPATDRLAFRAGISKAGMSNESMVGMVLVSPVAILRAVEDNSDLDVWRYYAGIQYYDWPRWRQDSRLFYYAYAGLGAISHSIKGYLEVVDETDPRSPSFRMPIDHSETKFMLTYGGGIVPMLNRTYGFEFGGTLDVVFVGKLSDNSFQYAWVLDFRAGLIIML